jgi:hypothetical protein
MKKIFLIALLLPLISIAQTKTTAKKKTVKPKISLAKSISTASKTVTNSIVSPTSSVDIGAGLKEALNQGITKQVSKLAIANGFYKNESVKILFPSELQFVDNTLRKYGLSHLADEGIRSMNHAAENAVKEATPIFIEAIKNISIKDAQSILTGKDNAATVYLQSSTTKSLNSKLQPIIKQSMSAVGADLIWNSIISKYNAIPLMGKVNPDISGYVTEQTLQGVFKMIAVEEKNIRTDINSRTSELLQQVFAVAGNNKL